MAPGYHHLADCGTLMISVIGWKAGKCHAESLNVPHAASTSKAPGNITRDDCAISGEST